jgi:hypothetical protein
MRKISIILIISAALTGCSHDYHANHAVPEHTTDMKQDVGLTSSSASSKTTDVSDYKVCLQTYAGLPNAEVLCAERMWARSPSLQPQPGFGPYGGYYGQVCGYPGCNYNP